MRLIKNSSQNIHVSFDPLIEFENTILLDKEIELQTSINKYKYKFHVNVDRLLNKFGYSLVRVTPDSLLLRPLLDKKHLFVVMIWLDINKYFRNRFLRHNRSIYLFDAWTTEIDKIVNFITIYKIDHIFLAASQSKDILNSKIKKNNIYWIPIGINPKEYKYYSYEDKNIDVLALGRKYDKYHDEILPYFYNNPEKYLYEKVKSEIIFPTRLEFIEGIARSKISICVPSNITHPERSGNIETMTPRYLQSMVSKCLIIGHAPKEIITLFNYNPIIEIDFSNPLKQLDDILNNFSNYIPFIEKNYQEVLKFHTWNNRWLQIKEILNGPIN